MARREVRLQGLGESIKEGVVAAWHATPGQRVEAAQPLCEVETDKATVTVEAPEAGWLVELAAPWGAVVAAGAVLAVYDTDPPAAHRSSAAYRDAAPPLERPAARPTRSDAGFARVFSGAAWEPRVGYCRAVRAGPLIAVSGTAPVAPDGSTFAPGDAYAQARRCLEIIESALRELGAGRGAVIRTRMFVTDIARWAEYGRAHAEFFAEHAPATTMVEVQRLIAPDMLIEIEADAWSPT